MIIFIISLVLLIGSIIGIIISCKFGSDEASLVDVILLITFILGLIFTPVSGAGELRAKRDEAIWNDMVANPTCYSTESLAEAHQDIVKSKYWATTPFSFHKGYDFPEINVNVMENTKKYHFVK